VPVTWNATKDYETAPMLGLMFDTTIALCRLILSGTLERHPGQACVSACRRRSPYFFRGARVAPFWMRPASYSANRRNTPPDVCTAPDPIRQEPAHVRACVLCFDVFAGSRVLNQTILDSCPEIECEARQRTLYLKTN
jgi:hypothetical protein